MSSIVILAAAFLPSTAMAETVVTQSHFGPFMVESQVVTPIDVNAGETSPDGDGFGANANLVRMIWSSSDGLMGFELEDNGDRLRSIFRADGDAPESGCVGGGVLLGYSPQPSTNSFWVSGAEDFENVISSCASANLENLPSTMQEYRASADHYTAAIDAMKTTAIEVFGDLWPRCLSYEGIELANDPGNAPCLEFDEDSGQPASQEDDAPVEDNIVSTRSERVGEWLLTETTYDDRYRDFVMRRAVGDEGAASYSISGAMLRSVAIQTDEGCASVDIFDTTAALAERADEAAEHFAGLFEFDDPMCGIGSGDPALSAAELETALTTLETWAVDRPEGN